MWLPGASDSKESVCQCRRPGFDSWARKIPLRQNDNPLQYACLRNGMDRGAYPWGFKELDATSQLNNNNMYYIYV